MAVIDWIQEMGDWWQGDLWIWLGVFVLILILLPTALRLFLKHFFHLSEKIKQKEYKVALNEISSPVYIGFFIYGIITVLMLWLEGTDSSYKDWASLLSQGRTWWLIFAVSWLLFRLVSVLEQHYSGNFGRLVRRVTRKNVSKGSLHSLFQLVRFFFGGVTTLVILDQLGFSVSTLMTFGGLGTIVIGFAGRGILENLFSGFLILRDRPFTVGDWIKVDAINLEGTVMRIGWRVTEVQSFDKRPLYVPNHLLVQHVVENPERMTHRRIYETIGIRFEDMQVLPKILTEVRHYLDRNPEIASDQTQLVFFNSFQEGKLDFFIYVMTNTTDWKYFHKVKEQVLLKVGQIIQSHGATIYFPLHELYYPQIESKNAK